MNRSLRPLCLLAIFACLALADCGGSSGMSKGAHELETAPAQTALPGICQELMNALPADSVMWGHFFSERGVFVDEGGAVMNKRELLRGMGPFPPGFAGAIRVQNPRVTDFGNVAVIVFDADESETVYGQHLNVKYLSTYTWIKEGGKWRIIAAQTQVRAQDPAPTPISGARLEAYTGMYELSAQRRYFVDTRGNTLLGGTDDKDLKPLIPVGENVFVRSGDSLAQLIIFPIGPNGTVTRMIQRRKFADLVWNKVRRQ